MPKLLLPRSAGSFVKAQTLFLNIGSIILFSLGSLAAKAATAQGELSGLKLTSCSENQLRCVTVTSEKASGSHIKPLYTMIRPSIEVFNSGKSAYKIKALGGYLDFELQRAVLTEELKPGIFRETIVDLKTLNISSAVMK